MNAIGPFDATARGGLKALANLPRRCEKPNKSGIFGGGQQHFNDGQEKPVPRLQVELVCQDETRNFDPIWDAPRLLPTFVTQVMGQAMPDRRENVSVQTAYGSIRCPRMALLLDRKS
jgi:hypothetical protein